MSIGIVFGSILASLCHQIPCVFDDRVIYDFGDRSVIGFDQKRLQRIVHAAPLFRHFVTLVPQVVFLKVPWLTLAPFWLHVGRFG